MLTKINTGTGGNQISGNNPGYPPSSTETPVLYFFLKKKRKHDREMLKSNNGDELWPTQGTIGQTTYL